MHSRQTASDRHRGKDSRWTTALEDRIVADPNYQLLKSKRTRLGWTLTLAMMVVYYGFILLVAFNKDVPGAARSATAS